MSIKHQEIEILPGSAFANCKLDRQKYATVLTGIIKSYPEGFVLAINNKWGTGKTTFVKMWQQSLSDNEFKTLYFNAWENDFENNALTALMGELKTLSKNETEQKFKNTLKKAALLSKHLGPLAIQALADRYINVEGLKEALVKTSEGLTDIFENEVNEYANKKKGISEFKKSLSEFVANSSGGNSLIFIIDELDRCRPDYAVSILEQIKHFFSVPNIVFVLSIDKVQLGHAIRGVYGSENIDADEYLRRFIDIEYSIPEPNADHFSKYLYSYFDFDSFFNSQNRKQHPELQNDKSDFQTICNILLSNMLVSLRQQEKILAHSRLVLRTFPENFYVIPSVYLFLIFLKITDEEFYINTMNKRIDVLQFQKRYFDLVKYKINQDSKRELMWLEAYLVMYLHNYTDSYGRKDLYEVKSENSSVLYPSIIDNEKNPYAFATIFQSIDRTRNAGRLDFGYFIKRIELTEGIIF